eukprot:TRINITY_DN32652_c0_g1_i1.p1 TRINITY_DN32652_c0_g1~~TRINITY_DN32652_c0_g1_i1.p1  ORF type:complete len:443 (+),score=110.87 TRINITY_DN32652_c0_g1_i1:183-1331(+)
MVNSGNQVAQLAERVSVLVAGVQRRCDSDKQELEFQIERLDAKSEARIGCLEARLFSFEERERNALQDRAGSFSGRSSVGGIGMALQEAKAVVDSALLEAQALWRSENSDLRRQLRDQLQQIEELAETRRQSAAFIEKVERTLNAQERGIRRAEEQLEILASSDGKRSSKPPWFGQLEGALATLDHRLNEQQMATEVAFARLQVDLDGVQRRVENFNDSREDVVQALEVKLEKEVERLEARMSRGDQRAAQGSSNDATRRIDESEARMAAIRVKVDHHDARFGSLAERIEGVCQQAAECARQVCTKHRDEIAGDMDCQLRVLRQRIETLSDLCEELMLRQISGFGSSAPSSVGTATATDFKSWAMPPPLPSLAEAEELAGNS